MIPTGRLALLLLAGLGPVVIRPVVSTAWAWALCCALAAALDWWRCPQPLSLWITRKPLNPVRLGEATRSCLTLTNEGTQRIRGLLRDAWTPSASAGGNRHLLDLDRGGHVETYTPLLAQRRGTLRARGVTVRLTGPWGLVSRQATVEVPGQLRCLPRFESRKHVPSRLAQLQELDGRAAVRVRGVGTEFDSLREYVEGDDVRAIDWRASARSNHVMVRTWQPERDRRVIIVMDTSRVSATRIGDNTRLDAAMESAQLLATIAGKAGDRVSFLAGDAVVRARILGGHGVITKELAHALSDVEPVIVEADWNALASALTQLSRRRSLVVVLTSLESSSIEETLLPVLPLMVRRHRVVVGAARDPEMAAQAAEQGSVVAIYQSAAAEAELGRRAATATMLETLGVTVVDADAESLPTAIVDHYLHLKRIGLW